MSDFGNNFVVLTDENGNEVEFEHVDTLEMNGETYMAFVPADINLDDEEQELVILKVVLEGEEEVLESITDEDEYDSAFDAFITRFEEGE